MSTVSDPDLQATFCATLVDEWVRSGVEHAVVSPGSRSTPLALALAAEARLQLHVVLDERSAAFFAVAIGRESGRPSVLLCTSGTAAVEFHPAVVEADLDRVPLLVCTADRPPELHAIGAPQTVDQQHLFGRSVRWFHDPGVPSAPNQHAWRSTASRAVASAIHHPQGPGPVHLNLPFREPLVGAVQPLSAGRAGDAPWHTVVDINNESDFGASADRLKQLLENQRGVLVAGAGSPPLAPLRELAETLGWPILADPRSGLRVVDPLVVSAVDPIVRDPEVVDALRPDVCIRFGAPWASKVLGQLLSKVPHDILIDPRGAWLDPHRSAEFVLQGSADRSLRVLQELVSTPVSPSWCGLWKHVDNAAAGAIENALENGDITEPLIARRLLQQLPDHSCLIVSSSMPIRDVEWFGPARDNLRVLANRGANGIDGVVSTILGVAATHSGLTIGLLGDLAFLHDAGALVLAAHHRHPAVIVVIDNGGGGIFEFLGQATQLDRARFELLFGTAQPVDIQAVCASYGLESSTVTSIDELRAHITQASSIPKVSVIRIVTDRQANVRVHEEINRAVAEAARRAVEQFTDARPLTTEPGV